MRAGHATLRALVCACAAVLAACGGVGPRVEPPAEVLGAYVAAVRADDAEAAYALLDEDTQAAVTFEEFARLMADNQAELEAQARQIAQIADEVPAEAVVRLENGEQVRLVAEEGRWAIEGGVLSAPSLRTPKDAVLALRRALSRRSLPGIERVLAREPRAEMEAEIERILEELADELDLEVEIRGNDARVTTTSGREILLVREAGEWRVVQIR